MNKQMYIEIEVMGMMHRYAKSGLEVEFGFYAEGHHDPIDFLLSATEQGYWPEDEPHPNDVEHRWYEAKEYEDGTPHYTRCEAGQGEPMTVLVY